MSDREAAGASGKAQSQDAAARGRPPALPRRPTTIEEEADNSDHSSKAAQLQPQPLTPTGTVKLAKASPRPKLQAKATTAVSQVEIHGLPQDGGAPSRSHSLSGLPSGRVRSLSNSEDDSASIASGAHGFLSGQTGDVESLLGDVLDAGETAGHEQPLPERDASGDKSLLQLTLQHEHDGLEDAFPTEFEPVGSLDADADTAAADEERFTMQWRAKLKHYLILTSAGKPIWSRHGDDQLISGTIGVIQTIISFFQAKDDTLHGFSAGDARFVVVSKGHLHLLAVSKLGESDGQLRSQLEALYMQILSTLTLPTMEKMFMARPSTDLRRPLQGTEGLISSLADGFTRGSPSVLLSALECLRIRKVHRQAIHAAMLKCRSPQLLYGLVVADRRLAAVVRPKKHSLHPGDLQLLFNMLFEADSIRAGGGESWIPVCLPGFNNTGFLYMYVSFLNVDTAATVDEPAAEELPERDERDREVAIILISASHEAFDELRAMRDRLVQQLQANGSFAHIRRALANGRSTCASILSTNQKGDAGSNANKTDDSSSSSTITGDTIAHFLYRSRANVQFVMPSASTLFASPVTWRRLMSLYGRLQAALHGRTTHLRVAHVVSLSASALAWTTPTFDIYVVAGPRASKTTLAKAAMGVVEWARREEERLFVVGGAVF